MKITSSIRGLASVLRAMGVVIPGHFLLKSGVHSKHYVAKERIVADPCMLSELSKHLAFQFIHDEIETVVAPAVLGGPVAHAVALHLSELSGRTVNAVIAEKCKGGGFFFGRSYPDFVRGKRALIVDDVITKGTSIQELKEAIWKIGGTVVGVGVLVDRGRSDTRGLKVKKFFALLSLDLLSYKAGRKTCPGCRKNQPLSETHGHRK